MVRIRQVVEGSQVNGEDAHRRTAQGQGGHDPWNRRVRRPSEPEQPGWHEDGLDADECEAALGGAGHFAESGG